MKNWQTLLFSIALVTHNGFAALLVVDKVAAVVNNGVVLKSEVDHLILSLELNIDQVDHQIPDDLTFRRQILERLILELIMLQIGQKMGITVTDEKLNQVIDNIIKLSNMTNYLLCKHLARSGISYNAYRNQIRKEMVISEVRNIEVYRRIYISDQEVNALAKLLSNENDTSTEFNLSHILIPLPKNPTFNLVAVAESKANFIICKARNGANFNELAITYPADQHFLRRSKLKRWSRIQELPSIFAWALRTARKGDIVGPIHSKVGFYILKVHDLRSQRQNFYVTEVRIRHIMLVPSSITTDNHVRAKLQQIASDIKNGKISFANAAKKFSLDSSSINRGGDLGWVIADTYDPAFRNVLIKLNKGLISAPIRSSFGWHLIELLDARNIDKTDIVKKDSAYRILFNRKFSQEEAEWMLEQRASSYVKVLGE